MALTDWTIIRRSMRARLFSTVTTAVTVGVAVALMIVLLSMRDSAGKVFRRGTGNMHMLVAIDASPLNALLNNVFYAGSPRAPMTMGAVEELKKRPIPSAMGMPLGAALEWAIPVQLGDSYKGGPVLATEPGFFTQFQPVDGKAWELADGAFFADGEAGDWQVVVGGLAARETGLKRGDQIVLTHGSGGSREGAGGGGGGGGHEHGEFKYTVVGVLKISGSPHDRALFTNLRSSWMIHAFDRIEKSHAGGGGHEDAHHDHEHEEHAGGLPVDWDDVLPEDRRVTALYLRVVGDAGPRMGTLLPSVFDFLRRNPGLVQAAPDPSKPADASAGAANLVVAQPAQEITRLMGLIGNVDRIILGIAACVLVSSGIAIMLALYNSMEQRRRQIAILRVLGCSRGRVFGLVLTEAAAIGMAGAGAGIILAMGGSLLVVAAMKRFTGLVMEPTLPWDLAAAVALAAVLLSALAGVIPAAMAYRTPVAKNLRPIG